MSVAFRREGDDEHMEPKFELPIPAGPNLVTPRGLAQIGARLLELETRLAGLTLEEGIKPLRRQWRYWSTRQSTAELAPAPSGSHVAFGCTVTIRLHGKARTVTIVGDDEADPGAGLLSFSAPLCRAIRGAEAGEVLDFAGRMGAIEILKIDVACFAGDPQ